jgi:hypothetical protein
VIERTGRSVSAGSAADTRAKVNVSAVIAGIFTSIKRAYRI